MRNFGKQRIELLDVVSKMRSIVLFVDMTIDATDQWQKPLTADRLFTWHSGLFPSGRNSKGPILVGQWRDDSMGPMRIVSGPIGKEKVHFQAPDAPRLPQEMNQFLKWFESSSEKNGVIKAGLAHLWFVTIHPFDDGNGRIGRSILDLALARDDRRAWRCYSVSSQIATEKKKYYDALEHAQSGSLDVTEWLCWFTECLARALTHASDSVSGALQRSRFWKDHSNGDINERQRVVLSRMLLGFKGKMTNKKWVKMAKCSNATAIRDLAYLVELGIFARADGAGRNSAYQLILDPELTKSRSR